MEDQLDDIIKHAKIYSKAIITTNYSAPLAYLLTGVSGLIGYWNEDPKMVLLSGAACLIALARSLTAVTAYERIEDKCRKGFPEDVLKDKWQRKHAEIYAFHNNKEEEFRAALEEFEIE